MRRLIPGSAVEDSLMIRPLAVGAIIAVLLTCHGMTASAQVLTTAPAPAAAQTGPPPLRIFLDCYECDTDHLRRVVAFVDYVRDRNVADLHVLVTTQNTGA